MYKIYFIQLFSASFRNNNDNLKNHYIRKTTLFKGNIPAVAFDCWALESLMREKVMREASSNGFDT